MDALRLPYWLALGPRVVHEAARLSLSESKREERRVEGARIRAVVFVPRSSNTGRRYRQREWDSWEARLEQDFGGQGLLEGSAIGVWTGEGGARFMDRSRVYLVALRSWRQVDA